MKTAVSLLAASMIAAPLLSQTDEIAPNENLVAQNIPKIPASLAEEVRRYTEFRSAGFQSWHPTRREVLITTRFADTNQIHEVAMPGGDRRQLTFYPDRILGATWEPSKGDYFVFVKDVGGGEFYQLYRYDTKGGAVTLLTDGKSRNLPGAWATKGAMLAYTSTRRTGKDTDVWVVDPFDPKTDRMVIALEGGGWAPLDWSPDDSKILLAEFVSANESYLWLLDVASGAKTALTARTAPGKEPVAYGGGKFAADGRSIYVTLDKGSEFKRLAKMSVAGGEPEYLTSAIAWDVEEFDLSRDGKLLAFATNEDGASVLRVRDLVTGADRAAPGLPLGVLSGLEWHENGKEVGFTFSSARSPADTYSWDPSASEAVRWTRSETGGLDPATFSEPELIRWKSFDGRPISGFLYVPPKSFSGKRPVLIDIHGGPEGQTRPNFKGKSNYFMNELGIAVIFPNVRGSEGFGKTFLKLDNAEKREDSVKDIGALLDWIATRPELDASRVMVTGGSYGGYMTLASAVHFSGRLRSALDVVGISNFVTFLEKTESYRRDLRRVEYGDERVPRMRAHLESIAPVKNAGKITVPLFVVQGKNDPRVPYTEAEQIVASVRQNGTPVWYLMANDEGHGFQKKRNADYLFYATVAFMRETLLH
jgi:dipeptidyl aminopeptidase/acylaminoacyl peptidase